MINAQCRGDKRQYSDENYQTVASDHVKKCRKEKKKRALGAFFCSDRKNLYGEKKLALSYFLDKAN